MAATPAALGFPDATNSGVQAGASLTTYKGPMTITQAGTVIDGAMINGTLRVLADNVTIKNSVINYNGMWGIDADGAENITIQGNDIVGPGKNGDSNAGILGNGNFIGNDISNSENGIVLTGGASVVKGNYIHSLLDQGNDPHYDGISVQGGQKNVLIEDNTIFARDTSDIIIKNDFGPISNVTVNHNYLGGDPGYNVYVYGTASGGPVTGVSITNNYVDKGFYGTYAVERSSPVISGNVEFNGDGQLPTPPSGGSNPVPTPTPTPAPTPTPTPTVPTPGADPINSLVGAVGQDWLRGGAASERLIGNSGNDALFGGGGSDIFDFNRISDSPVGMGNRDLIHDFQRGLDKVDLSGIDAVASRGGNQSFAFLDEGSFRGGSSQAGQLKYHYETNNGAARTIIEGTTDNQAGVDFQISLVGHIDLSASDFIL